MKKALTIIIFGCILSLFSFGISFGAEIWTGYFRIDRLDVQDGLSTIWLEGNDGCNGLYRLQYSHRYYKELLTLLMGAFFAGYEVNIKYQDTPIRGVPCELAITKVRVRQ